MAIATDLKITVKGSTSKLSKDVYLWLGDGAITLLISIVESSYVFGNIATNIVTESQTQYAKCCILKPNNQVVYSDRCQVINGKIKFVIAKEFIDELEEEGTHLLQIHLYDEEDNRLSIPPVTLNILKPICEIGHTSTP